MGYALLPLVEVFTACETVNLSGDILVQFPRVDIGVTVFCC